MGCVYMRFLLRDTYLRRVSWRCCVYQSGIIHPGLPEAPCHRYSYKLQYPAMLVGFFAPQPPLQQIETTQVVY